MKTAPVRIQLSRKKGFNLQAASKAFNGLDAVNVARPGIWGNPFIVGEPSGHLFNDGGDPTPLVASLTLEQCISFYREMMHGFLSPEMHPHGHEWMKRYRKQVGGFAHPGEGLRSFKGKNLACWCRSGDPCHADVLLELANGPSRT